MKHPKAMLVSLCAAAVLSACGGGGGSPGTGGDAQPTPAPSIDPQENTIPSLADLRLANDPLSVLKHHQTVSAAVECRDAAGNITYSGQVFYTLDDRGRLRADTCTDYPGTEDREGSWLHTAAYAGETAPGAFYYHSSSSLYYINCYPSWEYDAQAAREISPVSSALSDTETVTAAAEEDGLLAITTTTHIEAIDYSYTSTYHIDPETYLLQSMVITEDDADGAPAVTTRWDWTYDGGYDPTWETPAVSPEEQCQLTLHVAPGQEQAETQVIPVSRRSSVSFVSQQEIRIFTDEALTAEYQGRILDVSEAQAVYYIVLEDGAG